MTFADRVEAGQKLAERLSEYAGRADVRLFALPRGGAVVGAEVAKTLKLPLDLIITRKIGAPDNEEYAVGALAETGEVVWNPKELKSYGEAALRPTVEREQSEAKRRIETYRGGRKLPNLKGKTAIIVDDGVATGYTMRAAVAAARHQHAATIVVAVPHGAMDSLRTLAKEVDTIIALHRPLVYGAVGAYYSIFGQTTDVEVQKIMKTYGPK